MNSHRGAVALLLATFPGSSVGYELTDTDRHVRKRCSACGEVRMTATSNEPHCGLTPGCRGYLVTRVGR